MARTHGWAGDTPSTDDDAAARIVRAAGELIDEGTEPTILDVAKRLGVTRQTVYRYYASTDELLRVTAENATTDFLADLAVAMRGIAVPADAVVEGIARTLEGLRANRRFGLFFGSGSMSGQTLAQVTSESAIGLGRTLLSEFDVRWDGWSDGDLDELVEFMLRTLQSFILDPGHPPRSGEELRAYLRRWVGPACVTRQP